MLPDRPSGEKGRVYAKNDRSLKGQELGKEDTDDREAAGARETTDDEILTNLIFYLLK